MKILFFFPIILLSGCSQDCNDCKKERDGCLTDKKYLQSAYEDLKIESAKQATNFDNVTKNINDYISNSTTLRDQSKKFHDTKTMSKQSALEMIAGMEKIMIDLETNLSQLSTEILTVKSENNNLQNIAKSLKDELETKKILLSDLKRKVNGVVGKTVNPLDITDEDFKKMVFDKVRTDLKDEFEKLYSGKIASLENDNDTYFKENNSLKEQNATLTSTLDEKNKTIVEKEKDIETIKKEEKESTAKDYYNIAKTLENRAREHKDFLKLNERKMKLLREAEKYYNDATKEGKDCSKDIERMKAEFPKHFEKIQASKM